mmetsp:Transcript_4025/g.2729  ORF Transcript_4025/g.2729 Transcript_4025/m.2729 type:complete len:136 (+) Transcript_4025:699-1106(+)|eukprot:CAMPEP_0116883166 /NCGR_PEP_ID=MMETSP0463-20121206/15630_1 /TAXON_ID=181622 /ORGANISM="Strombidinopsis sp, Strain SopsisLIS2011" /LENGTH=135 /DNA_ID=CAMNT_0004537543 /DNA_START=699 /DNA_END=1106 /DNA_ORIENTATION=+
MNKSSSEHTGSSRSHCALILELHQLDTSTNEYQMSKFHLVDLAGAERPSKTGANRPTCFEVMMKAYQGKKLDIGDQGVMINFELSGLGSEVVRANEAFAKKRAYAPPEQLTTPAIIYMGQALTGSCLMTSIVTLS